MLTEIDKDTLFHAANSHYNKFFDVMMALATYMGQAEVIFPVLILMFAIKRFRNYRYFGTALACNLIPFLIQQILKAHFNFPRPMQVYHYNPEFVHYLKNWPYLLYYSFPSGHTVGAFSFFCFLSLLLPESYKKFGVLFFILALMVGYSRMYLAAHFFRDVYFGSMVGITIPSLMFYIMGKLKLTP